MRIPLHLKADDFSQEACEKRAELAAIMTSKNPNGFRTPTELQYSLAEYRAIQAGMMEPDKGRTRSIRGDRKMEMRKLAKDRIRKDRLDFIKKCEETGWGLVPRYHACKELEKRRAA